MNKRQFVRQRRGAWRQFEELLIRFGGGSLKKVPAAEVVEFSRLFRELSSDLATVRSRAWGAGLAGYLNDLVARGHNTFYSAPAGNLSQFVRFVSAGYPRLFRANVGYFFVAAALFFGPFAISWAVVQTDPSLASRIIPNEQLEHMDRMYSDPNERDAEEDETDLDEAASGEDGEAAEDEEDSESGIGFGEERSAMFGFYVNHNVGIALECYARGILLGIGSVWALLYNGIAIGAIAGYIVSQGHSERFLSFVVSHGSFELTAIAVAGGAGLMLGDAIVHRGQRTLVESLQVRGLDAVKIAAGAALMLTVAAVIEAFWSPAPIPAVFKYVVGGVLWVLVFSYLGFAGRGDESRIR